jgi:hypothetical protein
LAINDPALLKNKSFTWQIGFVYVGALDAYDSSRCQKCKKPRRRIDLALQVGSGGFSAITRHGAVCVVF